MSDSCVAPGKHTLEFDFKYDGLGIATLTIDRPKLSPEDIKKLEQARRNNRVSE